jgi:uncharacterized damage-inducible protein DinB
MIVVEEAIAILARTPRVLDAQLRGLPAAWTEVTEGEGTWSARNVLGHLIDGEERNWIPRARVILSGGGAFKPFDRLAHLARTATVPDLLDTFAEKRAANLDVLRAWRLGPHELAKTGEHPEFGRVTLDQLLATWVAHDCDHLGQVARVLAGRYGTAVGPWKAYLSILKPRG